MKRIEKRHVPTVDKKPFCFLHKGGRVFSPVWITNVVDAGKVPDVFCKVCYTRFRMVLRAVESPWKEERMCLLSEKSRKEIKENLPTLLKLFEEEKKL